MYPAATPFTAELAASADEGSPINHHGGQFRRRRFIAFSTQATSLLNMAVKTENILFFGATGLIGQHILKAILDNKSSFGRIAVFTSPNTVSTKSEELDKLKKQGVEVIAEDITSADDLNKAYNGFDTVVSAVGRPIIQHQIQMLQLADAHSDVKRFFPSEYGTDIAYGPESVHEKPHQQKLKVRAAFKEVKKLEYTYVVTGPYGDADTHLYLAAIPESEEEGGTFDVARKRAILLGDGNGKISLTTMRDVGKLVAAALLHPEHIKNKAIHVNSFTTTPKELVAEFERQTGGDPWRVDITDLETLKKLEKEAYAAGAARAGSYTLRRIWTSGGTLYEKRDNDLIGMEDGLDSLQTTVAQAIEVQKKRAGEAH